MSEMLQIQKKRSIVQGKGSEKILSLSNLFQRLQLEAGKKYGLKKPMGFTKMIMKYSNDEGFREFIHSKITEIVNSNKEFKALGFANADPANIFKQAAEARWRTMTLKERFKENIVFGTKETGKIIGKTAVRSSLTGIASMIEMALYQAPFGIGRTPTIMYGLSAMSQSANTAIAELNRRREMLRNPLQRLTKKDEANN